MNQPKIIKAQAGPQEQFLATGADIAIYGGAAGGGKSYALLLEALRHKDNKGFGAVIFRRTSKMVMDEGGLWDTASLLYPEVGAVPNISRMKWNFESGAAVTFAHMEHEKNKLDWQGSQIPYIGFDELTHFSKGQFTYMFSRNRSTCGVKPYIRATCNPDPQSWVKELIDWYLDKDKKFADPAKSGVIRYFLVIKGEFKFGDTREELEERFPGQGAFILTFTFIPSKLEDNAILRERDPMYEAKLMAMGETDALQLRHGDWSASDKTALFKPDYFKRVYAGIPEYRFVVQSYDTAFKTGEFNDPTVCTTWGVGDREYYLLNVWEGKLDFPSLKEHVVTSANRWRADMILVEDAASGQSLLQELQKSTRLPLKAMAHKKMDKVARAAFAAQYFEQGKVVLGAGDEFDRYKSQLLQFPSPSVNDDMVDSTSYFFMYAKDELLYSLREMDFYTLRDGGEADEDWDDEYGGRNGITGY